MITFIELNNKYTPNNNSTNFSNNTCRRRLLDKYIGAGNWEYVYEGRKAIGINLINQEEDTEEQVIETVVEQEETLVEEEQTSQPTTIEECDKEIERCENTILELQSRIQELKQLKKDLTPSHIIFKSTYRFRRYAVLENITSIYEEATDFYNKHKNEPKMDKVYKDLLLSYAKYLRRHINEACYESIYTKINNYHVSPRISDKANWKDLFKGIYKTEKDEYTILRRTMDDYEEIFSLKPNDTERIEKQISKYHDILEDAYNTTKNINKKAAEIIKQLLDNEKANLEALEQAKIDDTELFIQFKNEYNKYKVEQDKHYKSWEERFNEQFFGGSFKYKTRSYKYFTGQYNSFEELKKEYRKLSRIYHPDMSTGSKEQFQEMNEEYESLKNKFTA